MKTYIWASCQPGGGCRGLDESDRVGLDTALETRIGYSRGRRIAAATRHLLCFCEEAARGPRTLTRPTSLLEMGKFSGTRWLLLEQHRRAAPPSRGASSKLPSEFGQFDGMLVAFPE